MITIYASLRPEAEKKLKAVARKAAKYGFPFSYSFGEPFAKEVTVLKHVWDPSVGSTVTVNAGDAVIEAVDVTVNGEDLIRKDGWTAVAKLEHFDNGNIINRFDRNSDYVTPGAWRKLPPRCEHCGITRQRNITYMVRDAEGTYRQVGSSCLHDYTGIDPKSAVLFAELFDVLNACEADGEHYDPDRERGHRIFSVRSVIAHAADSIAKSGYHSVNDSFPTANAVGASLMRDETPSPDALAKADRILAWLQTDEAAGRWSLIDDCITLAKEGWCKSNHIGRLAYLPVAYDKELVKIAAEREREAAREKAARISAHVGTIGERITVDVATFEYVTSWETVYGFTHLYKFTDTDGNVYVWFASSTFGHESGDPAVKHIKATVKDHTERDGVKQTVLTRCKIA